AAALRDAVDDDTTDSAAQRESAQHEKVRHEPDHHASAHHGADDHGHGADHFAHILPMPLLVAVAAALIVLTVLTVGVTAVDLGSQGNFIVAMVIATVKAVLVMGIFMHMVWDSKFNVVAFTSSFLFVLLFLSMAVLDRSEYRTNIDQFETDMKIKASK
ncbi:MAG TPA: cytochrome C oxidase subunit IV family protein, partial [Polyangiaceae bacterium]|nr:cytochrome C oxidase subunit IV family protein [Polyangiaceae bacterium]